MADKEVVNSIQVHKGPSMAPTHDGWLCVPDHPGVTAVFSVDRRGQDLLAINIDIGHFDITIKDGWLSATPKEPA